VNRIIFFILITLISVSCSEKTSETPQDALVSKIVTNYYESYKWRYPAPPSVNGVTLGTTLTEVLKKFGKPLHERTKILGKTDPGIGDFMFLSYDGLELELFRDDENRPFTVSEIIVSKSWDVYPGIKIGMSSEDVIGLIGKPLSFPTDKGDHLGYVGILIFKFEGGLSFELDKGKVIKIVMNAELV